MATRTSLTHAIIAGLCHIPRGALTRHLNKYHWEELEKEAKLLEEDKVGAKER